MGHRARNGHMGGLPLPLLRPTCVEASVAVLRGASPCRFFTPNRSRHSVLESSVRGLLRGRSSLLLRTAGLRPYRRRAAKRRAFFSRNHKRHEAITDGLTGVQGRPSVFYVSVIREMEDRSTGPAALLHWWLSLPRPLSKVVTISTGNLERRPLVFASSAWTDFWRLIALPSLRLLVALYGGD